MEIDSIYEEERVFTIRLIDESDDFEDITVNISSEVLNPKNPHFAHCKLEINTNRHRTIKDHIKYFETACKGLKELQKKLEEQA